MMRYGNYWADGGNIEAKERGRFKRALRLLGLVFDELDPSEFTFEEIREMFNSPVEERVSCDDEVVKEFTGYYGGTGPVNRFGRSDLDRLEGVGYIAREGRSYYVLTNPFEDMMEGYDDEDL